MKYFFSRDKLKIEWTSIKTSKSSFIVFYPISFGILKGPTKIGFYLLGFF